MDQGFLSGAGQKNAKLSRAHEGRDSPVGMLVPGCIPIFRSLLSLEANVVGHSHGFPLLEFFPCGGYSGMAINYLLLPTQLPPPPLRAK